MDTRLSDIQVDLRDSVERFFTKESPLDVVRAAEPLGFDASLWRKVVDGGWADLGVPEHAGGQGASLVDVVFAALAHGRTLAPVPLVEATVARRLLARVNAAPEVDRAAIVTVVPRVVGSTTARAVPAGAVADAMVTFDGTRLLWTPLDAGPRPSPVNLGSMPIATCEVAADALVLAEGAVAKRHFATAVLEWKVLTAASLVGLGERAMEIALDYVKDRTAFGTVIGSFQGVAHPLADDTVALDGAYLLSLEAAWGLDEEVCDAGYFVAMAYYQAIEAARKAAADALHVHGGIGFTLEASPQLFLRRAKAWPLVCGDPEDEFDEIAAELIRRGLDEEL